MTVEAAVLHAPRASFGGRSPRIAILGSRGIPARYGGFETFVEELAPRLVRRGSDVTVFCEAHPGPSPTGFRGVRLEYVPARAPGPLRAIEYDLRCLWRARRRFDVVYMLGYGASFGCFLPRLAGREVWINMDGLEWRRSKWGGLARWYLRTMEGLAGRTATRLVFDNAALAGEVVARRRWQHVAHTVLAYGAPVHRSADPAPLANLGLQPDGYDLVLCRCEPENHILEIIRAHRAANGPRPLVVVANSDLGTPYCGEVLAWQGEAVRFTGAIYDAGVVRALRFHCHTYLHGHSVGGTNPSLIEAMGSGAFVVAHDNPYNRDVLGETGEYFADEAGLLATLERTNAAPRAQRRVRGEAARARIEERYTWEAIADQYADLLGAVASRAEVAA